MLALDLQKKEGSAVPDGHQCNRTPPTPDEHVYLYYRTVVAWECSMLGRGGYEYRGRGIEAL